MRNNQQQQTALTVRIDPGTARTLKTVAAANGSTVAAEIRMAIAGRIDQLHHDPAFLHRLAATFDMATETFQSFVAAAHTGGEPGAADGNDSEPSP